MRSHNAHWRMGDFTLDIVQQDDKAAAAMLNRHLRWCVGDDNLVSWTSSQLVALQYMLYLHTKNELSASDIRLYVVDTSDLPSHVFVRDMDLIQMYDGVDPELDDVRLLRQRQHRNFRGYYYFGEYLSQGSLKIEGHSEAVTLAALLQNHLDVLQPLFNDISGNRMWANQVIYLREALYSKPPQMITEDEARAAISLSNLFEPRWRIPMAAYFLALVPRTVDDGDMMNMFSGRMKTDPYQFRLSQMRLDGIRDHDRNKCSAQGTKIMLYPELPEVVQFEAIMRAIYKEFAVTKVLGKLVKDEPLVYEFNQELLESIEGAERLLRRTVKQASAAGIHEERPDSNNNTSLIAARYKKIYRRVNVCQVLTSAIEEYTQSA